MPQVFRDWPGHSQCDRHWDVHPSPGGIHATCCTLAGCSLPPDWPVSRANLQASAPDLPIAVKFRLESNKR